MCCFKCWCLWEGEYFCGEESQVATVTSSWYAEKLWNTLQLKLSEFRNLDVWFQQDRVLIAHFERMSMEALRELFVEQLISFHGDTGWLPGSLDIAPCNYFFCCYLKTQDCKHRLTNIDESKVAKRPNNFRNTAGKDQPSEAKLHRYTTSLFGRYHFQNQMK